MEGEIRNFIMIWASAILCLCYCNVVSVFVQRGKPRLMAILPVILFFVIVPLHCLHTCHLGAATAFCLSWLASFKLLLLSFDTGPLSDLKLPVHHFVALACLPIIKTLSAQNPPQYPENKKPQMERNGKYKVVEERSRHIVKSFSNGLKSPFYYARRAWALLLVPSIYTYKESIHPVVRVHVYAYFMYIIIEILTVTVAIITQWLLKLDLEQPFNEPYSSTSLRDFWGRRWNRVATDILRSTIFNPIFYYTSKTVGHTWALIFSVMGTFLVSALMHELFYYQIFRILPNWSFIYFFVVQGLCLVIEGGLQYKFAAVRQGFPPPFVFCFVMSTFAWFVMVDLVKHDADTLLLNQHGALWRVLLSQVGLV